MEFGLAVIGNYEQDKSRLIVVLSNEMKLYLKNKCYGSDIKSYTIGVVCISPQFEEFFKRKKPRYTRGKKESIVEGIPFTIENNFEYDIKLNFETFKNVTNIDAKRILAKEILASINVLDEMKSKIKDFDNEKFKVDLENYFKTKELI